MTYFIYLLFLPVVEVMCTFGQYDLWGALHHDNLMGVVARAAGDSQTPLVGTVERDIEHLCAAATKC